MKTCLANEQWNGEETLPEYEDNSQSRTRFVVILVVDILKIRLLLNLGKSCIPMTTDI